MEDGGHMDSPKQAKELVDTLKGILDIEVGIVLLSLLVSANLVLVRGLHIALPRTSWNGIQTGVPVGGALLFLCLFGFYLTAGANLMRIALFEIFGDFVMKVHDRFRTDTDVKTTHAANRDYVSRHLIRKKADQDSDMYYLRMYEQLEDADNEMWQLSARSLGCIVVLVLDAWFNGSQSVVEYSYSFLRQDYSLLLALAFVGLTALILLGALLTPLIRDWHGSVYCPGFPGLMKDAGTEHGAEGPTAGLQ
jgi:hypothetical protein